MRVRGSHATELNLSPDYFPCIRMNYNDLTRPNSPQMVGLCGWNSPPTAASFRLVKYSNSPRCTALHQNKQRALPSSILEVAISTVVNTAVTTARHSEKLRGFGKAAEWRSFNWKVRIGSQGSFSKSAASIRNLLVLPGHLIP